MKLALTTFGATAAAALLALGASVASTGAISAAPVRHTAAVPAAAAADRLCPPVLTALGGTAASAATGAKVTSYSLRCLAYFSSAPSFLMIEKSMIWSKSTFCDSAPTAL